MNRVFDRSVVDRFFDAQLSAWDAVAKRFADLRSVETREVVVDGLPVRVQFNPSRIVSSAAKVDAASIDKRPCFLCDKNRPVEQTSLDFGDYRILVNPFPICPFHLTIPSVSHTPQSIRRRIAHMVELAQALDRTVIFYNGPRCGASAPDHMHFQAVDVESLPLLDAIEKDAKIPFGVIVIDAVGDYVSRFGDVMDRLPMADGDPEPKVNLLCYRSPSAGVAKIVIIPRKAHRPSFYGSGVGQMLVSPASVDLGGVMVAPRREDFDSFNPKIIRELYSQLCFTQHELDDIIG